MNEQGKLALPRTSAEIWDYIAGAADTMGLNRGVREVIAHRRQGDHGDASDSDRRVAMGLALDSAHMVAGMLLEDARPLGMTPVRYEDRRAKLRSHLRALLLIASDLVWP
jgi:hypothetical protein